MAGGVLLRTIVVSFTVFVSRWKILLTITYTILYLICWPIWWVTKNLVSIHTLGLYENLDSKILPNRNTLLRINLDMSCLIILVSLGVVICMLPWKPAENQRTCYHVFGETCDSVVLRRIQSGHPCNYPTKAVSWAVRSCLRLGEMECTPGSAESLMTKTVLFKITGQLASPGLLFSWNPPTLRDFMIGPL